MKKEAVVIQHAHQYKTDEIFCRWLDSFTPSATNSILIQIFSGVVDADFLQKITRTIIEKLPQAVIIGTTTSGEILNAHMLDKSLVISLSLFDQTQLKSVHIIGEESEAMGRKVAETIIVEETKCVIMFADALLCNGEAILRGLNSVCSDQIVVAGGMSGDNSRFKKSYCIHGSEVFQGGVVAVSLSNPALEVFHTYNLSWKPIGKKMTVTKSEGNKIFEIDNEPIKEIISQYLGKYIADRMPASTIEFPLIYQKGGVDIARSIISMPDDGGIIYAGELREGQQVRFGIGSPNMLIESVQKCCNLATSSPIESLFVYSCIARKAFLGKELELEYFHLAKIAPVTGFFTYGEFYHGTDKNELLNVTTTVLGLSESKHVAPHPDLTEDDITYGNFTISALMNLVEVTLRENETYALKLRKINRALKQRDELLIAQAKQAAMGDMIAMIAHQWRQPLNIISMQANNLKIALELEEEITSDILRKHLGVLDTEVKELAETIENFSNYFKPNQVIEQTTIEEVLKSTVGIIGQSLENEKIRLTIQNHSHSLVAIVKSSLVQILLNILGNAKDLLLANPIAGAAIHVVVSETNEFITLSICDNAGGIPDSILDKIGQPYFTTKEEYNGVGLGLYIARTIVEKHLHGTLTWHNEDQGACFVIKLKIV
jgi:hypothetical protein